MSTVFFPVATCTNVGDASVLYIPICVVITSAKEKIIKEYIYMTKTFINQTIPESMTEYSFTSIMGLTRGFHKVKK